MYLSTVSEVCKLARAYGLKDLSKYQLGNFAKSPEWCYIHKVLILTNMGIHHPELHERMTPLEYDTCGLRIPVPENATCIWADRPNDRCRKVYRKKTRPRRLHDSIESVPRVFHTLRRYGLAALNAADTRRLLKPSVSYMGKADLTCSQIDIDMVGGFQQDHSCRSKAERSRASQQIWLRYKLVPQRVKGIRHQ